MEIIELRRGDFIYRGAAGRGMGVLGQNVRSYALSVSILLWKNKKKNMRTETD